jgi:RES domain-containing protein
VSRFYRISNHADLQGIGGLRGPGRWHTIGHPVVYMAENPSSAMLETLVHLEVDPRFLPRFYQLLLIEAPDAMAFEEITLEQLPENWQAKQSDTRRLGDGWLQSLSTPLLRVPSALTVDTWNWLLNPRHPEAKFAQIIAASTQQFDRRLF